MPTPTPTPVLGTLSDLVVDSPMPGAVVRMSRNATLEVRGRIRATGGTPVVQVKSATATAWQDAEVVASGSEYAWRVSLAGLGLDLSGSPILQVRARTADGLTPLSLPDFYLGVRPLEGSNAPILIRSQGGEVLGLPETLVPGKSYNLRATPQKLKIFSHWLVGNQTVTTPRLAITPQSGLELTAVFKDNPYPALAGSYNGIMLGPDEAQTENGFLQQTGFLSFRLNGRGALSGQLRINQRVYPFRGRFDGLGNFSINLPRRGGETYSLNMKMDFATREVRCTLIDSTQEQELVVELTRSSLTGKGQDIHPLSQAKITARATVENEEMEGTMVLGVSKQGRAMLAGRLPDGAAFTRTAFLVGEVEAQRWSLPVFVQLYPQAIGLLAGEADVGLEPRELSGVLGWLRPAHPPARSNALQGGYFGVVNLLPQQNPLP
jgi:hypothetical protein